MTAKITANVAGNLVTIGTAAEDALQIDSTAKIIKALAPYTMAPGSYANDSAAATAGVPIGGLYHTSGAVKVRLT